MGELLDQHQALEHEVYGRSHEVLQRDGQIKSEAIALIARLAQSLDDAKTPSERTVIFHAIQLWTEFLRDHYRIVDAELSSLPAATEPRDGVLGEGDREASVSPSTVTSKPELRDGVLGEGDREASVSPSTVTTKLELRDGVQAKEDREVPAAAVSSLARDAYIIRHAWSETALEIARSAVDIGYRVRLEMIDSLEASFSETLGILRFWVREPARIDRIGSEVLGSLTRRGDRTVVSVRRLITTLEGAIEGAGQARAASVKLAGRRAGYRPEQVTPRP